jgi:hypothetical protein
MPGRWKTANGVSGSASPAIASFATPCGSRLSVQWATWLIGINRPKVAR